MKNYKNPSNIFDYDDLRENPPKFRNVKKPSRAELEHFCRNATPISDIAFVYRTYDDVVEGWLDEDNLYHPARAQVGASESEDSRRELAKKSLFSRLRPKVEETVNVVKFGAEYPQDSQHTLFPPTNAQRPTEADEAIDDDAVQYTDFDEGLEDDYQSTYKIKNVIDSGETWSPSSVQVPEGAPLFPPTISRSEQNHKGDLGLLITQIKATPLDDREYNESMSDISVKDVLGSQKDGIDTSKLGGSYDRYEPNPKYKNDEIYRSLWKYRYEDGLSYSEIAELMNVPYEQVTYWINFYKMYVFRDYPTCGQLAKYYETMTVAEIAEKYDVTRATISGWAKACGLSKQKSEALLTKIGAARFDECIKEYLDGVPLEVLLPKYDIPSRSVFKNLLVLKKRNLPASETFGRRKADRASAYPKASEVLAKYSNEEISEMLKKFGTLSAFSDHLGLYGVGSLSQELERRGLKSSDGRTSLDPTRTYPKLEELFINSFITVEQLLESILRDPDILEGQDVKALKESTLKRFLLEYFESKRYVELLDVNARSSYGIISVNYNNYSGEIGLVKCPAGRFEMGVNLEDVGFDEKFIASSPRHTVEISSPFWMSETEVTQDIWEAVMGWNESSVKGPKLPVTNISRDDALLFCGKVNRLFTSTSKIGVRKSDVAPVGNHVFVEIVGRAANPEGKRYLNLPTSAEWEYAATSGGRDYPNENDRAFSEIGWSRDNASRIQKVGLKAPNSWGLYDMLGNVNEWCVDCFNSDGYIDLEPGVQVDPESKYYEKVRKGKSKGLSTALGSVKIVRGGSVADSSRACNVSLVKGQLGSSFDATTGFRFVIKGNN